MNDKGSRTVALFCLGLAGVFALLGGLHLVAGRRHYLAPVPLDLTAEGLQQYSLPEWPGALPWLTPGPPEIWLYFERPTSSDGARVRVEWRLLLDDRETQWSSAVQGKAPIVGEWLCTAPAAFTSAKGRIFQYRTQGADDTTSASLHLVPSNTDFYMALELLQVIAFGFALLCALVALLVALLGSRRA